MLDICNVDFSQALNLYIHIPTIIVLLLLGLFIFLADSKNTVNRNLSFLILVLIFWVLNDFLQWMTFDESSILLFSRLSILGSLSVLILLYFAYAFSGKELSARKKIYLFLPFLPVILFIFSNYNTSLVSGGNCDVSSGLLYIYLILIFILYVGWSVKILFDYYGENKQDKKIKNQVKIIAIGFASTIIWIITILGLINFSFFIKYTGGDNVSLFISVSMLFIVTFTVYAIAKYQLLNIKIILTQIMVIGLLVLIGSQFLLVQNKIGIILTGITFVLSLGFGYMLVRSVKKEVEQREALEIANKEIKKKSDQLEAANEKLKQLDRAKTDFINFASHQLRTPITSIKGFSSLLTEGSYGELAPAQKEAVKKIEIVTGRMASLVEDFLSASRIDSGTMKYEFEKCKIEDICQEVATTLFPKANSNKLYLKYEKPIAAMPELLIDGSKTRETISNLVDNAIKYTKEGGVTMSLELAENQQLKTNDKRVVRIIVSDTGIGIPKDELAHLFAKFSRGLDIKRLTASGTGLGLFVGKSMIEKQGGKVWAESEGEGKGSRFIVELPVQQSKEILGIGGKV